MSAVKESATIKLEKGAWMMSKKIRVFIALLIIAFVIIIHYVIAPFVLDSYFDFVAIMAAFIIMPRPKFAFLT